MPDESENEMKTCIHTTIRGGFPITVVGNICRAEPDVGLPNPYVDGLEVWTKRGRPADFLHLTEAELQQLEEKLLS